MKTPLLCQFLKKGDCSDPSNFSLLSVIGKLYTKLLQIRFNSWLLTKKSIDPEQIGFSQGKSVLEHCLILSLLINKYVKNSKSKVYVAFLDLNGAFDSISRTLLWKKLADTSIDKRLLFLISRLYTDSTCQVRKTDS